LLESSKKWRHHFLLIKKIYRKNIKKEIEVLNQPIDKLDELIIWKQSQVKSIIKIFFKEKDKEIEILKNGISDEIDNLREELKKSKKKIEDLTKMKNSYLRVIEDDKEIFKEQREEIRKFKFGGPLQARRN